MKKGNSQRLKKYKKFAFGNSQFTRQHNNSLIGTNKYRRPGEEQLTKLFTSVISHQPGGRRVGFKFDWEKKIGKVRWNNWQQFPWTKKVASRTATLLFDNACILKQKTNASFAVGDTVRLRVQIRVRLDSPLMNWTSSREYLEVSNVSVWYKANGSVCWISWELNFFMSVFSTFAIRSWLLLLCYWLHSVINPHMRGYYIIVYILESKKSIGE